MLVLIAFLIITVIVLFIDNVRMRMADNINNQDGDKPTPPKSIQGGEVRPVLIPTTIQLNPKKGSRPVFKGNEISFPNAEPDEDATPPPPPPDDQPDQDNVL